MSVTLALIATSSWLVISAVASLCVLAVAVSGLGVEKASVVRYSNTVAEPSVVAVVPLAVLAELVVKVLSVISGWVSVVPVILLRAVAVVVVAVAVMLVVSVVALGLGGVVVVVTVFVLTSLIPFDVGEGVSESESPAAVREEELRSFSGSQPATVYRH